MLLEGTPVPCLVDGCVADHIAVDHPSGLDIGCHNFPAVGREAAGAGTAAEATDHTHREVAGLAGGIGAAAGTVADRIAQIRRSSLAQSLDHLAVADIPPGCSPDCSLGCSSDSGCTPGCDLDRSPDLEAGRTDCTGPGVALPGAGT